jgi:hypothetical protein
MTMGFTKQDLKNFCLAAKRQALMRNETLALIDFQRARQQYRPSQLSMSDGNHSLFFPHLS